MLDPEEHERVLELLRRARRPESEITPETVEENLRWLIRMAVSEDEAATDELKERIRAIVAARTARPPSRLARLRTALVPHSLAWHDYLAVAALAACILLALFVTTHARAQMLARTLAAMAAIRSAHCTGWHVEYRGEGEAGVPSADRVKVDWWYKAPDRYRMGTGHVGAEGHVLSEQLVVNGDQNAWADKTHPAAGNRMVLPPPVLAHYLSALDFFDRQGFLHRAQAHKAGHVTEREGVYQGRAVRIVEVAVEEKQANGDGRNRWRLYVDPASDRIVRSETRFEQRGPDGVWTTLEQEVLDYFQYNVPIRDSLFDINTPAPPRPQPS